ncbi:Integrase catalytic domain-containing protein [Citrus sinensis]|nr:Integrase catalytic domain-containing protein [Citrus sinensis]
MVEGETSRIGERSTETISGDISGGRRDLSNRYSAPVIGDQKIDVEKFNGKINFVMLRREVMGALIQIDLDVVLKNKRHLYDEEIWDHMNEKAYGHIRSCLTKEVKYLVKDKECAMTLWRTLEEKYLLKSPENRLHAMSQVYGFRMKSRVSMHDHVSRFEKLLANLKNLDEDIKDEVKAMILDWVMEKKKKRGGKNSRSKLRSRNIARDECAFCHEKGHWRKDCLKAQKRDGKKPAAANMARKDEDSDYSLSYKVTIRDGIMKFTHGAMVILQGVRHHNLYYLKGGTTNEANVAETHSDTTELWHVRLGHAGEKSLQTLMRHGLLKDKKFWAEAVSYESHLVNWLPSAEIGGKTPMEIWSGKHAQDYNSLRIFECPTYYHVKDGKLNPRARKAIFVGFKGGVKGFKLWDLKDKKFVCSRDVTFDEVSMIKASSFQQVENKTKEVLQRVEFDATPYVPISSTSEKGLTMEVTPRVEEEDVSSNVPQNEETIDDVDNDDFIATRRPRREIKKPG